MILAPLIAAAAVAPAFAPPVGTAIRYESVAIRPLAGNARVTLHQTLRFTPAGAGYIAETIATDHQVEAPPPYRAALEGLFATSDGIAMRVRLDGAGRITGVVDAERAWAAVRQAEMAHLATILADPASSPERKAAARATIADNFDKVTPEARDARLADGVAALLEPPLPAMAPGESRRFASPLRSAAGALAGEGVVTLVSADSGILIYRIEVTAEPTAAIAALEARIAVAGTSPAVPRLQQALAGLRGSVHVERSTIEIDGATGLIRRSRTDRLVRKPGVEDSLFETDELTRTP